MVKTEQKEPKKKAYDASSITVLEGLEPVRKRPGMYIGTTGPDGLHHLVWEIFDNARDEAMGGFADDIEVALLPDGYIRVADNGRGVPVGIHPKTKVSALETIMTTLHAGGKFGGEDSGYKISGGLHGVGASVVNALSEHTKAVGHQDGGMHMQEYKIGKPVAKVKKIGISKEHGTIVLFKPDAIIFKEGIEWNLEKIVTHLRQQAYLVKGVRVSIIDARNSQDAFQTEKIFLRAYVFDVPSMTFYFEGGLKSLVAFYNNHQTPVHKNIFYVDRELDGVNVEVALQYVDDITSRITAFANNTYNSEGGTHITGFKTALTRSLNTYGRNANILKEKDENFTGDDVLEGITAVVSVKLPEIQFEGQTKAKLGSVEAQGAVATIFSEALGSFLEENPDDARSIINKVLLALKARKAAKAAKDSVLRKGALEGMTLPGKLADCQVKSAAEAELFIVEGDSAGGCFSGDTCIALTDGRSISFKELVQEYKDGKKNYCYTIGASGDIEVAEIKDPRVTKRNASVIKIVLDNGEEIICTPNHRFMIRDGNYKEAHTLSTDDSLMPLRRQLYRLGKRITIKGYELVYTPASHRWILESKNKARIAHASPTYREKIRAIMSAPKMRAMLSKRAKIQWENESYKRSMVEAFLRFRNSNAEYRKKSDKMLYELQLQYWSKPENRMKQSEYNVTYLERGLKALHDIYKRFGRINPDEYNKFRKQTNNKTLLRFSTLRDRFFGGDDRRLAEAVTNYIVC